MYTEKVMDHFMHPRNVGEIEDASGVGTVGNAKCGDIMRIYLDIDDKQVVRDAKFKTFGCGAAIATSSMATEMIIGKSGSAGAGGHQQGGDGGAGRAPAGEGALLAAGRAGRACCAVGLCAEKRPCHRRA